MIVLPFNHPLREIREVDGESTLRCSKCRAWKATDQFSPNRFTRSGYQSHCRPCQKEGRDASRAKAAAKKKQKQAVEKAFSMSQKPRYSTRKPLQPQSPTRKPKTLQSGLKSQRKAIRKVSDKRRKELAEYSRLRAAFLAENPVCQCGECRGLPSTEVHHKKRRGKYYLDVTTWMALSNSCHSRIEQNPADSKSKGFIQSHI